MPKFDVAVIGAGLAGLRCAHSLARRGLRVVLADKKHLPWSSIHTTGIFVRRTLVDFRLPAWCLGPPIRDVVIHSPSRRSFALHSPHDEFRVADMRALYEHIFDDCLRLGVAWLPDVRYSGLEHQGQEMIVYLQRGFCSHGALAPCTISVSARFVVGADGAVSQVARDLGLDRNQRCIVGLERVFDNVPAALPPALHCFLDPRLAPGYLAWLVHDGAQAHIGVGGNARRFDPQRALARFQASLADVIDLRHARAVEHRGGRIPVGGVLRNIANDRGLLVGDAAGAPSPLTAGGLDACLRLSDLAAAVIERLATGDRTALRSYDGRRFGSRFSSRRWMRWIFEQLQSAAALDVACALLGNWPMRALTEHIFFGRSSFPDAPLPSSRGRIAAPTEQYVSSSV